MENTKIKDDTLEVKDTLKKDEPSYRPDAISYPKDGTINTVKGIWDTKYGTTIMIMSKG